MTSALRWGGWSAPRPGRFTPWKDPVPIVQEAGQAPGPVWAGAEDLAPTGIRSPDRSARSESLYRLSYSGPLWKCTACKIIFLTLCLFFFWVGHNALHVSIWQTFVVTSSRVSSYKPSGEQNTLVSWLDIYRVLNVNVRHTSGSSLSLQTQYH